MVQASKELNQIDINIHREMLISVIGHITTQLKLDKSTIVIISITFEQFLD